MPNDSAIQPAPANGQPEPVQTQAALATVPHGADLVSPFSGSGAFEAAQRMAKALASSSLVPQAYRGDIANCLIAMELASRIGVSVLAAMQNLHIIQGKPSWSSQFLIATVNASGRFTPLRFEKAGTPGKEDWAMRAVATDRSTNERCEGPWITWEMAGKEGWRNKNGSKWQTMPELMFCYRAAAFWSRIFCPEISIGFRTAEEMEDVHGGPASESVALPSQLSPGSAQSLEAVLGLQRNAAAVEVEAEATAEPIEAKAEPVQAELIDTKPKAKR
jgi:hypothetical protein